MNDLQNQLNSLKESFLWSAAKTGRTAECASLLQMSPDLNWSHSHSIDPSSVPTNEVLDTPLLAAARSGHAEVVALLLAHNADTSKISVEGDNVVHLSIKSNNMSLISLCLDATAASLLKKKNYKNMLPLDVAKSMPNARLAVSKIEKIMGIAQSIGAMEGGEEAAQLPTISTALRRTVQENRSQEEGGGEDEGEEAEEDEDDEESSEWETDSGGEELSEHDNNIDDVGGGKATPDSKFPHAMSVGAWHRSMQNEKQDNNTNKDKNTQEKVKVTIPLTAAEKFQPALMHLQIDNELSSLKVTLVHERQVCFMPFRDRKVRCNLLTLYELAEFYKSATQAFRFTKADRQIGFRFNCQREHESQATARARRVQEKASQLSGNRFSNQNPSRLGKDRG